MRDLRRAVGWILGCWLVSHAALAQAEEEASSWVLAEGVVYLKNGTSQQALKLPGRALGLHTSGQHTYVALGEWGAAVLTAASGDARVEKLIPVSHGSVTGFLLTSGQLWMQINSTSAVLLGPDLEASSGPLTVVPPTPQASSEPHSSAPNPPPLAPDTESATQAKPLQILKVFNGIVMLNQGSAAGLRVGDRLKVVQNETLSDEGGVFHGEREVAVLVVDSVSLENARARIWRGDRVALTDRVERAEKYTEPSLLYPRQLTGFVEAELHVRPILNIGQTGFGALIDANLSLYQERYFIGLRSQPLGLGRTAGSTTFTQTSLLEGGYNSRPFALGLGLGVTSVYGDLSRMFEITSFSSDLSSPGAGVTTTPPGSWRQAMQHAFTLGQRVRLGAMDGLNLTVANNLLYFGGKNAANSVNAKKAGFIWGGSNARLTVPLALTTDMFFEGGGGVTGFAYGAVGVFSWLRGNGGDGSLGLLASAGGAGVWSTRTRPVFYTTGELAYTNEDSVQIAGPLVSLGLRYRYGLGGAANPSSAASKPAQDPNLQ